MSAIAAGYRRLRHGGEHGVRPYTGSRARGRVAWLYLRSRRNAHTVLALAAIAVLVWWVMDRTPTASMVLDVEKLTARNQTLLVHLTAMLLASVVGVGVWSPFGEPERVSPVVLPVMRGVHLLSLLVMGVASVAMVMSRWDDAIPGVDLVWLFARNTLFLTGCVVLAGRVIDIRLAWMLPVLLGGITIVDLLQQMRRMERVEELWQASSWNVLAQNQSHGVANAICLGVGLVAIAAYIRDGVRDSEEAE